MLALSYGQTALKQRLPAQPLLLMSLLLLLSACGSGAQPQPSEQPQTTPTSGAPALNYDTGAVALIEYWLRGGFRSPLLLRASELPLLRVYGDGMVIYQSTAEQTANQWRTLKLTPIEVQALLQSVLGPQQQLCTQATISNPPIADAPTTEIVVHLRDRQCQAQVYALGIEERERPGLTDAGATLLQQAQVAATALQRIQQQPGDPFIPSATTLFVNPLNTPAPASVPRWPLKPEQLRDGLALSGADAQTLLEQASQPRAFALDGQLYEVVALPTLP